MTERLVFPGKRKWLALVVLVLVAYAIPAFAQSPDYEPTINSGTNVQASTDDNAPVQPLPDEDVLILLDIPDPIGSDKIADVRYLWTKSKTALSWDDLTENATYLNEARTSWSITRSVQDFVNDDSDTIRYLHVMTFYFAGGITPSYSSETVIALNIDNVAPTGTVRIVDGEGNDITTTSSSQVDVNLSADSDTVSVYLSEAPARPGSADSYTAQTVFAFSGTSGDKTLYAWFEDTAGNISSQPVTDTVTLIDSSQGTINPSTATLDLADVKEQLFVIEGAGDTTFNWEISNGTVAKFVGESNGTRNATVEALAEGSFVVTATPVGGGTELSTGVNLVKKLAISISFSLTYNDDNTSLNAISVPCEADGLDTISDLYGKIADCDGIQWWDADSQTYKSYSEWDPATNLPIIVGSVYFVSISAVAGSPLVFEGKEANIEFVFKHNADNTSLNSMSLPYGSELANVSQLYADVASCDGIQWWDAATQTYKSYSAWDSTTNINVDAGDPLFISVTQEVVWP
jgi:hypothetical protein